MRPTTLAALCLLTTGCRKIDPAPKELGALMQFFFADMQTAEDETVAEAIRNLDGLIDGTELEYQDGTVVALEKADTDATGYTHADPADATGLYMVNAIECGLGQLADLVTTKDVVEVYGVYETFERDWTSDIEAFRDMDELEGSWDDTFHYKSSLLGIDYIADTDAQARSIPDLSEEDTPWGPILLTRRSMIEPAVNENEEHSYPQDWRAELYYERSDGYVVHVAGMWREAYFGSLDHTDEIAQRTMLNGLKDWDKDSSKACEQ